MSSPMPQSPEPAQALAAFDAARDAFLAEFAHAPDAALAYVPPGEEYALGALLTHLCHPIERYLAVFERVRRAGFGLVDLAEDPDYAAREARNHAQVIALRPTGADRPQLLAALQAAHERVRGALATLDPETYTRQAPVIYAAGSEPYPTSARDILGWLIDHYREHTAQIQTMLAGWSGESAR
jgi:uncharacterized damage-inducible protein DinB